MIQNPFIIKGYAGKAYFCDREEETQKLVTRALGGSDSAIISPRRLGKSGLVMHVLETIEAEHPEIKTLYTDIYATSSLDDLVENLSSAILATFPAKTRFGKRFMDFMKSIRPYLTFDPLSGIPQFHLDFATPVQKEATLKSIFDLLDDAGTPLVFSFYEFQQITEYPEKNVEALLRTYTQNLHNIRFLFSGSKRRLMTAMFNDATRPFYASVESLSLGKLNRKVYSEFILSMFRKGDRTMEMDALDFVLDWTRIHTYYTQRVCHNLFDTGEKHLTLDIARKVCQDILDGESFNYLQLREILPIQQWRFLIGLAKEEKVTQITANSFISKYKIGSAATSRRAAESLEEKELILKTPSLGGTVYEVYDVFFSRWLQLTY